MSYWCAMNDSDNLVQFKLMIPAALKDRVMAAAQRERRSLSQEIVATLEEKYPAPNLEEEWEYLVKTRSRQLFDDHANATQGLRKGATVTERDAYVSELVAIASEVQALAAAKPSQELIDYLRLAIELHQPASVDTLPLFAEHHAGKGASGRGDFNVMVRLEKKS